jgi:hypothetical protein
MARHGFFHRRANTTRSNGRVVQFDMAVFYGNRGGPVAEIREVVECYEEREIGPLTLEQGWIKAPRPGRLRGSIANLTLRDQLGIAKT